MKKFIAILTCLVLFSAILPLSLAAAGVPIDATNFPDPVFREYARQVDTDKNGSLSDAERLAVRSILLENKNNQMVTSVVGIKNFPNLECLSCKESNLTEVDLSGMVHLQGFSCGESNLESLNLSGCTALDFVSCQFNRLTQIDLTGCSALVDLLCNNNRLTKLDVSDCVQLEQINIYGNQIASIDVSKSKKLVYFTVVQQEVTAQKFQKNGKWTVDLGVLVGKENLSKITSYNIGKLNAATGLLTFDTNPSDFKYTYKASDAFGIDVHVTLYQGGLPVITADNLTIDPRDTAFDPLKESGLKLKAIDVEDGDLTASVKTQVKTIAVWGSAGSNSTVYNTIPAVDTKKPGFYIISYTVKDSSGNTAALDVYITVRADQSAGPGPFSIITRVSDTSSRSNTSSREMNAYSSKNSMPAQSTWSVESAITPPLTGTEDSCVTAVLILTLVTACAILLFTNKKIKGIKEKEKP